MRRLRRVGRVVRGARLVAWGLLHTAHPLLAQLVPVRRCNLACTYCNEFDHISEPIALEELLRRLDKLAALGTEAVGLTGGEPMLHPQLDDIIRAIRHRGMIAALLTNGYLLSEKRIRALNRAGLDYLQISIDNVEPDDVSKKSLRLLDRKLEWLRDFADFDVNINTVLGAGTNPQDAIAIHRRITELGLTTTVGLLHDGSGHLQPMPPATRAAYEEITHKVRVRVTSRYFTNLYSGLYHFEDNLIEGRPNQWRCRAGARYLYICEDGLVHYCSQQRGYPGIPLARYTIDDIRREFNTPKPCAPYCTIGCVHRVSYMDFWRRSHN